MVIAASLVVLSLSAPAQTPDRALFRSSTRAVQLDVYVGKDDKAVLGLGADDFAVFDDGVRRDVTLVETGRAPLSVALVVDASHSVAGERLRHLKNAARSFVLALDDDDRSAVLSFSHQLTLGQELTDDTAQLTAAIDRIEAYGATAWRDALFVGLKLTGSASTRPLILLFTDGEDTYSWLTEEQVRAVVDHSSAVVYAIAQRRAPIIDLSANSLDRRRERRRSQLETRRRTRQLRSITRDTGGGFVETDSSEQLQPLFLEILAEMKTRYILTYRLAEDTRPGWHELRVEVPGARDVEVRARRGYFYEPTR